MVELPEDVLLQILHRMDVRAKCRALSVCRDWAAFLSNPDEWGQLVFRSSEEQKGVQAIDILSLAKRAGGRLQTLSFCRCARPGIPSLFAFSTCITELA
jgi:hypothetical protein